MSKRIKKIRDDFFELDDKVHEAYESGDMEAFEKYQREFLEYICKFQKELKVPDEQIEDMRKGLAKRDKISAEINYLEAKIERLKREAETEEQNYYEALKKEEAKGRKIKWN